MATEMIRLHIEETGEDVLYPRGVRLDSLAKDYAAYHTSRIMAARVNNDIRELFKTLKQDATYRNGSSGRLGIAYSPLPSEP